MEIIDYLKRAEELAENVDEKYQKVTYQELLRHFLQDTAVTTSESQKQISQNNGSQSSNTSSYPKASLLANNGTFKQQVCWAILRLEERGEDGTVSNVQKVIDLELSQSKPSRTYTSKTLGQLTPDYLGRKEPEEGRSYIYYSHEDTINIFNDLKDADE